MFEKKTKRHMNEMVKNSSRCGTWHLTVGKKQRIRMFEGKQKREDMMAGQIEKR
jgi:hypothetical protein